LFNLPVLQGFISFLQLLF